MKQQKEPTQWDKFKEELEKNNKTLQENETEFIKRIEIDFEKEVLIINGKEVKEPVIVSMPHDGKWQRRKIFNFEKGCCGKERLPEISIKIYRELSL